MFKKVLIAEDLDSISLGLHTILESMSIIQIETSKYCDDAIIKFKKAIYDNEPFDLLVTDLSFKQDHRNTKIASGEDLITAVKTIMPATKILAYSIEDKPYKVRQLFDYAGIDAYICKSRESAKEFPNALKAIYTGNKYVSPQLEQVFKNTNTMEIDQNDVAVLRYLMNGLQQDEISQKFKEVGRSGSSTSSIEKRINKLKIFFKAKTNAHLISIAKDMGVI